jgi:outer membrane lipoprotein-sorting protein
MRGIAACVTTCIGLALMSVAAIGEEKAPIAPPATAPSNSADGIALDARQKDIVDKVSSYFSGINTLQGSFLQTGSDNRRMKGKFYLSRPGRFRFDYARPSRQIVISDGRYLAVQDLDLNNEDRVPLDQTPFRLLLRTDVNLVRDARIMEVQESEDLIVIVLQDKDPNAPGQIKLFLTTKPDLELKEWVTRDAQGLDTRVEVSDLDKTANLDSELFKITAPGWKE